MKRLRHVVLLGTALLLAGCGPRVAPDQLADAAATPSGEPTLAADQGVAATAEPAPGASASGQAAVPPGSDAPEPPAPSASPDFGPKHNTGVVRIELSATCVKPGDILVVTFRTPPKAGLGMVIGYSDNQAHGAMLTGESDANGLYVWRVPVDPTVPDGDAKVLVSSTGPNWEREGGGSADKSFRVTRGGC